MASEFASSDPLAALQDGFLRTDAQILRHASEPHRRRQDKDDAGSAAVVTLATADRLYLAHAGDCRAILVKRSKRFGSTASAQAMASVKCAPATRATRKSDDVEETPGCQTCGFA